MIPKIIHYCWFGGNPKSEIIQQCIESWKKYCPDYEIIEWNESNFDVNCIPYTAQAYADKKWAFVSDYARLAIVHKRGGVYLDTDVMLHNSLDELLQYDAWFAQDDIRYINTGLGFGACMGCKLLEKLIECRTSIEFDGTICNAIDTPIIREHLHYPLKRETQVIDGVCLIGMLNYGSYAKHYETNSWKTESEYVFAKSRVGKLWKLKVLLRNPYLIDWLEKNGQTKLSKIYVFCVYDLLDCGLLYFIKRFFIKIKKIIITKNK